MSDIFTRRLLAGRLVSLSIGMIAALAASGLATTASPGQSLTSPGTYKGETSSPAPRFNGPSPNNIEPTKPNKAQAGSQKQNIKAFQRAQYVKAECAQLKAQMQNPGLSSGQVQSLMSQYLMLHCK